MSEINLPGVVKSEIPLGVGAGSGGGRASATFDPVGTMKNLMQMQLMGNQNNLFQQQFDAQKALGPIAQSAVGEDGKIDWGKYAEMVSRDPRTAFKAPEILASLAQRQQAQVQMEGQQLEQAFKLQTAAHTAFGSLVSKPQPTSDDMYNVAVDFLSGADPALKPRLAKAIAEMISSAPRADPTDKENFPKQSQALREFAMSHFARSGQDLKQLHAYAGEIGYHDTGSGLTATQDNPGLGTSTVLGTIPKGMTPAETNAVVPGAGPGGSAAVRGDLPIVGGGVPPAGTVLGGPAGTSAAAEAKPGDVRQIGLTASQENYFKEGGTGAAKYESELNETVKNAIPLVQRIAEEMEALRNFTAGPGEATRAKLAEALTAVGMGDTAKDILRGDLKDVHAYENLVTQQSMEMLKQTLSGQGRITDSEMRMFNAKYPNLSTDPGAAEKIYNFTKGIAQSYYVQQQKMAEFRGLMRAGKLPNGMDMQDFPAWYNKQMVESGGASFKPTFGEAKGSTLVAPGSAPAARPAAPPAKPARRSLSDIFSELPR